MAVGRLTHTYIVVRNSRAKFPIHKILLYEFPNDDLNEHIDVSLASSGACWISKGKKIMLTLIHFHVVIHTHLKVLRMTGFEHAARGALWFHALQWRVYHRIICFVVYAIFG